MVSLFGEPQRQVTSKTLTNESPGKSANEERLSEPLGCLWTGWVAKAVAGSLEEAAQGVIGRVAWPAACLLSFQPSKPLEGS